MLTVQQAALFLKISEKSIRRYIKSGRLNIHVEKGPRGDEYRIERSALLHLLKPQRGRPQETKPSSRLSGSRNSIPVSPESSYGGSHKTIVKNQSVRKIRKQEIDNLVPSPYHLKPTTTPSDFTPVGEIIKETSRQIVENHAVAKEHLLDYKILYEGLLNKYEQALVIVGSLEAQLTATPKNYEAEIAQLRDALARQEELVLELYQIVKMYKEEKNNTLPDQEAPTIQPESMPSQELGEGETVLG